jgi:periplasmic protein CpxP/Spy
MSRLTKLAVGVGSLGLVAMLAAPVVAQGPEGHGRRGRGPGAMRMGPGFEGLPLRGLDLTDAQREQVRGIVSAREADFKALGERLRTAREAERAAVTRVPVDENEIRTRVTELAAVQADVAILRARIHEQVQQVLTPEQQAKAKTLQAERQKRRTERAAQMQQRRQQRQAQPKPQQ